jgi:predicted AlkP superfamily phosphohydrolase/phosphomutase
VTSPNRKLLIIGLDSAPPELVFDRFLPDLPNIRALIDSGTSGPLRSTIPPITVPAWASMMTGRDPGSLGVYGLRNRVDRSYKPMEVADSGWVVEPTLWDLASAAGLQSVLVGIPQTYPVRPVNGCLVSSFLTPDTRADYTYPPELRDEVEQVAPGYLLDVPDFRTDDKERVLRQIYEMTAQRFRLTRHLITSKPWDLAVHVEMGTDRINHAFWRYLDESHRKHDPASTYRYAIRDYYRYLDGAIGDLVRAAGVDTTIMLVSDHGAKRIDGGICVNEWLLGKGYLCLNRDPVDIAQLEDCDVNWTRTKAWGAGGYYARIFLNVAGREPQGALGEDEYDAFRDQIAEELAAIPDPDGNPLNTRVFKPEEVYSECKGIPPDLIVYFDDLFWRSVGTIGTGCLYAASNDTGPDDANHAQFGIFVLGGRQEATGEETGMSLLDVAPTALSLLGLSVPAGMQGVSLIGGSVESGNPSGTPDTPAQHAVAYTDEEKQIVEERLRSLGYL